MWSHYETWLPSARQVSLHCLSWNSTTCRDRLAKLNNAPGCLWGATHPMKAKRILISQKLVSPSHSHINFCNQRWMLKDLHSSRTQCSTFVLMSLVCKEKNFQDQGSKILICSIWDYWIYVVKYVSQFLFVLSLSRELCTIISPFLRGEFSIWWMQNMVIMCLLCLWWC